MGHPDQVLVARLTAGDDAAIGEIFDRYADFLLGVARRVGLGGSAAEDVVQEVLCALWQHPDRFDANRGSLRAYLGVQAQRRAVDALRSDTRRRAREHRYEVLEPASDPQRWNEEVDSAAAIESIRGAIARLPANQRVAVELAFWNGHTQREVAAILGIPEGTAKSRLRLAQTKLSQWLVPLAAEIK